MYQQLLRTEGDNIRLTEKHYKKAIDFYIESVNLLHEVVLNILGSAKKQKRKSTNVESVICVNCARIISSSRVLLDLVMKGYYYDAYIIQRSLVENALLIECFTRDEKYAKKWVNGELKMSKVKEKLGLYSSQEFVDMYATLSDFVHANAPAIIPSTFEKLEKKLTKKYNASIFFTPRFEKDSNTFILLFPFAQFYVIVTLSKLYQGMVKRGIKTRIKNMWQKWDSQFKELDYLFPLSK
jgi:hypothetical protein